MRHFFSSNKLLVLIFLIALFLRVYRLGELPVGFHADEARVAWNSYSILKTGTDDRGNTLSLYYNTFGDYRPTGIFYLTLPSIAIFGLTVEATRLPSSLLGALSVFPLYYFVINITKSKNAALFAAFFLAVSSWHISASRSTSEVVMAVFFFLLGFAFTRKRFWPALICLVISIFLYHSARIVIPLFLLVLFLQEKTQKTFLLFLTSALVVILLSFSPNSLGRLSQISIINDKQILGVYKEQIENDSDRENLVFHNRPSFFIKNFLDQYTQYFGSGFLTHSGVLPQRYESGVGLVSYTGILLILLGVVYLIKLQKFYLLPMFLLISVIPAALTTEDSPNMHRALFMTPFLASLAGLGMVSIQKHKVISGLILLVFCLQIFNFWHMYRKHSPFLVSNVRNGESFELLTYLDTVDENYEKIILPNQPDNLYPWFAMNYQLDPAEFNPQIKNRDQEAIRYQNYEFSLQRCPSDIELSNKKPLERNILVVDRGEICGAEQKLKDGIFAKVLQSIKHPNGEVAYTVWEATSE